LALTVEWATLHQSELLESWRLLRSAQPPKLVLTFTDGSEGAVDLQPLIGGRGGVFAPLQDPDFFARVEVDHDAGTIVWPNGVDLDPDVLFQAARRG
jgi:hypothetical protein